MDMKKYGHQIHDSDDKAVDKQKLKQTSLNSIKSRKPRREVLWEVMLEEDGVYIGHIQWHLYRTTPGEGASTSQAVTVGGPLPGAV